MRILDKYIGRTIVINVIFVMAVLVALSGVISFAGEFGSIGRANYTIWLAIEYTLLRIPTQIYEFFPLASLLGALLGLGALANRSELIIIRSAGVSLPRIAFSIMKAAFLLMLLAAIIGEFIAPPAKQYAQKLRVKAMASQISLNTEYGLWVRDGRNFVHVERVDNEGRLIGIYLYNFDERLRLQAVTHAISAEYHDDGWLLKGVKKSFMGDQIITTTSLPEMTGVDLLPPDVIKIVTVEPDMLSMFHLVEYIQYLYDNGLDSTRYNLAFWNKLIAPLTIAIMIMIAIPFVFGSLRTTSVGGRILLGFLIGVGFFILNRLTGQAGLVYHIHPAISASTPTFVVFIIVIWMFRRASAR